MMAAYHAMKMKPESYLCASSRRPGLSSQKRRQGKYSRINSKNQSFLYFEKSLNSLILIMLPALSSLLGSGCVASVCAGIADEQVNDLSH